MNAEIKIGGLVMVVRPSGGVPCAAAGDWLIPISCPIKIDPPAEGDALPTSKKLSVES